MSMVLTADMKQSKMGPALLSSGSLLRERFFPRGVVPPLTQGSSWGQRNAELEVFATEKVPL